MPEKETIERAREDARERKSPSTQAGEFVREEMHHIHEGKHGARSTKQAIAIGLSKARRAGVKLSAPKKGKAFVASSKHGRAGSPQKQTQEHEAFVKKALSCDFCVLKRESHSAASKRSLSRQARSSAGTRGAASRHRAAMKAVNKGKRGLSQAAKKGARTREWRAA